MRSEPLPVIGMVEDASVTSKFSYLTGDSESHSTVALSDIKVVMASQIPTNVPPPTALSRKDVAVPPKETVTEWWPVKGVIMRPLSQSAPQEPLVPHIPHVPVPAPWYA